MLAAAYCSSEGVEGSREDIYSASHRTDPELFLKPDGLKLNSEDLRSTWNSSATVRELYSSRQGRLLLWEQISSQGIIPQMGSLRVT